MGLSAKPIGKFQSIMRKIKNEKDAEAYTVKHMFDKKKEKKEEKSEEDK